MFWVTPKRPGAEAPRGGAAPRRDRPYRPMALAARGEPQAPPDRRALLVSCSPTQRVSLPSCASARTKARAQSEPDARRWRGGPRRSPMPAYGAPSSASAPHGIARSRASGDASGAARRSSPTVLHGTVPARTRSVSVALDELSRPESGGRGGRVPHRSAAACSWRVTQSQCSTVKVAAGFTCPQATSTRSRHRMAARDASRAM